MSYLLIFLLIAGTVGGQAEDLTGENVSLFDSLNENMVSFTVDYWNQDSVVIPPKDTTRWYVESVDTTWRPCEPDWDSDDSTVIFAKISSIDTIWAEKVQVWLRPDIAAQLSTWTIEELKELQDYIRLRLSWKIDCKPKEKK